MSADTPLWQHFPHSSDIGVRGVAETLAGAFEQAALALTAVVTDPGGVVCKDVISVECAAPDLELLLCDWLNALIYEMALRKMVFGRFEVTLEGTQLFAKAWGETVVVNRHHPAIEVKGATYTELKVFQEGNLWEAQCVVDV